MQCTSIGKLSQNTCGTEPATGFGTEQPKSTGFRGKIEEFVIFHRYMFIECARQGDNLQLAVGLESLGDAFALMIDEECRVYSKVYAKYTDVGRGLSFEDQDASCVWIGRRG